MSLFVGHLSRQTVLEQPSMSITNFPLLGMQLQGTPSPSLKLSQAVWKAQVFATAFWSACAGTQVRGAPQRVPFFNCKTRERVGFSEVVFSGNSSLKTLLKWPPSCQRVPLWRQIFALGGSGYKLGVRGSTRGPLFPAVVLNAFSLSLADSSSAMNLRSAS